MLLLALALDKIVGRAQAYINARTQAINELRKRIESFVSLTALMRRSMLTTLAKLLARV